LIATVIAATVIRVGPTSWGIPVEPNPAETVCPPFLFHIDIISFSSINPRALPLNRDSSLTSLTDLFDLLVRAKRIGKSSAGKGGDLLDGKTDPQGDETKFVGSLIVIVFPPDILKGD
jgi:hypothetical protein